MIKKGLVRHAFNYDADKVSKETGLECKDDSLTLQSQREEADINVIVRKFGVTGLLPQARVPPTYGDFSGVSDYREALELVREADASFMQMPAKIRAKFENDPAAFVDFCMNPANLAEMREMGLAVAEPVAPAKAPEEFKASRKPSEKPKGPSKVPSDDELPL